MGETLKDLRELPLVELIRRHDAAAPSTMVGVTYYLEEIARRDAARQAEEILRLTRRITSLTLVIAVLTAINVVLVLWATR